MPDFPELRDGASLEPWHFNVIYDELRRWRKLSGTGTVAVSRTEGDEPPLVEDTDPGPFMIQLTATWSSSPAGYAWKEVIFAPGRAVQATGVTGGPANGDPAFELQTGDTTLTVDSTVYVARRSRGSNLIVFDGKN